MGIEEQKEEREVLASIFPDEITGMYVPLPRLQRPNQFTQVWKFESKG
jgi:hypothetical protein